MKHPKWLSVFLLILLCSFSVQANEGRRLQVQIKRGETKFIPIGTALNYGTLVLLPDTARLGAGDLDNFHFEDRGRSVLLKPVTPNLGVKTNFWITLPGETIITFWIESVAPDQRTDLVEISWTEEADVDPAGPETQEIKPQFSVLQGLVEKSEFKKTEGKGRVGNLFLNATGVLLVGDKTYVKFEIENRENRSFTISRTALLLQKMGGFTGRRVQEETEISQEVEFSRKQVEPNGKSTGVIVFSTVNLDLDENLNLKVFETGDRGRVLSIRRLGL